MSKRPARDATEDLLNLVPQGPFGVVGGGNAVGGIGYFAVSAINGVIPVDGVNVGFNIESHNIDREGEGAERHTFLIWSASEDVARFTAKFKSSPTIAIALQSEVDVVDVQELKTSSSHSLWQVKTEVIERKGLETVTDEVI